MIVGGWTPHQQDVWSDRYALKDAKGNPLETGVAQTWQRVAKAIAQAEKPPDRLGWSSEFERVMSALMFLPGGRIIAGAGSDTNVTYYNCFGCESPEDSRGGIVDRVKDTVEIMARGGGFGINLSTIRPKGYRVEGVNGTASGPVSWAEFFSQAVAIVEQGGTRKGAAMLLLDISHPDVEEFITAKDGLNRLQHANLSLAISDDFMSEVEGIGPGRGKWDFTWGREIVKTVDAKALWRRIAEHAWRTGDPGVVFLERYNKLSNSWYCDPIVTVNPCSEQGLGNWGACNLGSINLSAFVNISPGGGFDYERLKTVVRTAVRFLDDVIDLDPGIPTLPQIRERQLKLRRIGLGTMGLADMLLKLGVRYGSKQSLEIIHRIYNTIRNTAYQASIDLARERGPFPEFDDVEFLKGSFITSLPQQLQDNIKRDGIRNVALLTQAPTGTISLLAGCSSGIEPVFAWVTKRKDRTGEHLMEHPLHSQWVRTIPPGHVLETPLPDYFVTAHEIDPEARVKVQAAIQTYTDSSISSTVNLPNSATVDDVLKVYKLAYDLGCKGITVFRDGCRPDQVLTVVEETTPKVVLPEIREGPRVAKRDAGPLDGRTYKLRYPHNGDSSTLFITVNGIANEPSEVFLNGKGNQDELSALGWSVSKLLQRGYPLVDLIENLWEFRGTNGGVFPPGKHRAITCLANAVAYALEEFVGSSEPVVEEPSSPTLQLAICPKCRERSYVREGMCWSCKSCGHSTCGG